MVWHFAKVILVVREPFASILADAHLFFSSNHAGGISLHDFQTNHLNITKKWSEQVVTAAQHIKSIADGILSEIMTFRPYIWTITFILTKSRGKNFPTKKHSKKSRDNSKTKKNGEETM
jgi:hypothetical protein